MQLVLLGALLAFTWVNADTDVCSLPKETGPCRGSFRRYFFNSGSGKCEQFVFGGCRGNENNFAKKTDCVAKCYQKGEGDVCSLPVKTGYCRGAFPRFFFNAKSGKCEKFIYGGCAGNGNNFKSTEECESRCDYHMSTCKQPKKAGVCRAYMPRFFFNSKSGKCEKFVYGGCGANDNNFETQESCENQCDPQTVCNLPVKVGPCRANMRKLHFNAKSGKCETFFYGGCQGNANNFDTAEECSTTCKPKTDDTGADTDVCKLPAETGPCRAAMPRFFFNSKSEKCEQFIYGGCRGNENNFNTQEDCTGRCSKQAPKEKRNVKTCRLAAESGPCDAYIPRYFFNHNKGQCEKFVYGGCRGNENNFKTFHDCENSCLMKKKREADVCSLPSDSGPCRAAFPRFFFNSKSGNCEQFIFGGCRGNENNFETKDACEGQCKKQEKRETDLCSLPAETGPCRAMMPRFHFNKNSGKCEQFIYGGCQGNQNNFNTKDACEGQCKKQEKRAADVCSLPAETGPCRAMMPRFHFNKNSGKCEQFVYGGCAGNENNFESKDACEGKCAPREKRNVQVCRLPAEVGLCKAIQPRFFFNHKTGLCEKFNYGGCGGNENNFKTLRDCENSCLMKKREADVCALPAETGPCRAMMPRFHFNKDSGKCEQFIYGGCQGNENNFETKDACEGQCKKQQKRETDVCSLPAETGPCRAMMPRFHFNKNSGKCEQFVYGGCGGNENNFASKDACEGKCAPREKRNVQVCRLPAEVGLCKAIQPRFFFNHKTGLCEKFNYGGCGGNENNFKTLRDCENSCLMKKREADVCALPAETGPCRAMMPRFHFNKQSGKCEQFIFGGCGGNENNFNTQAQCESQCASSSQEKSKRGVMVGVCRQEPKSGPCYAYIPRFFFNHKTGTCEKFVFGGCLGNENNFKSLQECERSCLMKKREVDSTCSLPAETGPCRAAMPRFHFNKNSGSCERFIYGGCGGNENNFQSQNQCEEKCMS